MDFNNVLNKIRRKYFTLKYRIFDMCKFLERFYLNPKRNSFLILERTHYRKFFILFLLYNVFACLAETLIVLSLPKNVTLQEIVKSEFRNANFFKTKDTWHKYV